MIVVVFEVRFGERGVEAGALGAEGALGFGRVWDQGGFKKEGLCWGKSRFIFHS